MNIVITIDGPAASGKTTAGILLAQSLKFQFVDSGGIYRIGTHLILQNNIPISDIPRCVSVFDDVLIDFQIIGNDQHVFVNNVDVSERLHRLDITKLVPQFASIQEVRAIVKMKQREIGSRTNTVMTGRDTGTEIYPDAQVKFFLVANAEIRARRRVRQLIAEGDNVNYDEILASILERDRQDATRTASPLRKAENAIEIDTTDLTIGQTYEHMLQIAKEKLSL